MTLMLLNACPLCMISMLQFQLIKLPIIQFVCKEYYYKCLVNELDFNSAQGSETYVATTLSKEEILHNHRSVLSSFGIQTREEDLDLPSLYWITKLHKNPYKQRYIAGSAKCSTKTLSQILTSLLSAIKEGLQKYCETGYSRSGVNQMWILKNSIALKIQNQNL